MKVYTNLYDQIISLNNLFAAWDEFHHDKGSKADVMRFEWRLEENIFKLHQALKAEQYHHGPYQQFYVHDPKQRLIHKAIVRDRVLHHAIFKVLNPIFEPTFIAHSFSCRIDKGTHRGVKTLASMLRQVSQNHTAPCFALKCDVKKFFGSVNQDILVDILQRKIKDEHTMRLLRQVIYSFDRGVAPRTGLPIGNLTSQLFANVYLNEFDQFMKHELKVKHYVRYTDDFVIVSSDLGYLKSLLPSIREFLTSRLALQLHPNKIIIRKFQQGIDFLGYVSLPHYIVLRTKTRRRIENKLSERLTQYHEEKLSQEDFNQVLQSYLGVLSHASSYKLTEKLKNNIWLEGIIAEQSH